jgi:hypothetical protein
VADSEGRMIAAYVMANFGTPIDGNNRDGHGGHRE